MSVSADTVRRYHNRSLDFTRWLILQLSLFAQPLSDIKSKENNRLFNDYQ